MSDNNVLVLHRRLRAPDIKSLHCRELALHLDEDGRHLVLSRYTELYSDDQSIWGVNHEHKVPLASLLRWMIKQQNVPEPAD
ncbi:hypothetical protein NJC38_27835 [Pseudomonas sp. 21LCFQ010]|uniref:hypothetical protein n=1 Tax=Pseudomonas sp. 21LCFQ010 TaxID=2957506 RepID=UPI0020985CAD|nr:hypothetical protein [Pseudomonas sp. 21LCFQ010]MCO8165945.1 hypothetical protein [Pseudomonas sp. 21LCFQ010]